MQKIVGFIMIFAGCAGLGVWYGSRFQCQISVLKDFCHMLELFLGEIRFGRSTLPECCLRLAQRMEEPYKACFDEIYERSLENSGESFEELCSTSLAQGLKGVEASWEDKELFINCFAKSGYEEDVLQLRVVEQTKAELEKKLTLMEAQASSRYRLSLSLGAMSGLLLIILLW